MSSSFQSTAATNIYDSPVDTFVRPVRVLPKTGIMDLAETLASVNENLRPFLNQSITKGVEKEKRKATKDRIFAEINGGEVAKLSNDIRKKDGDDAARKIIGGSRVYRQQYEKAGVQLEALKFKGNFENAYMKKYYMTKDDFAHNYPIKNMATGANGYWYCDYDIRNQRYQSVGNYTSDSIRHWPNIHMCISKDGTKKGVLNQKNLSAPNYIFYFCFLNK